jgi:hypothetical protein
MGIVDNALLATLSFPSLSTVASLDIRTNPSLTFAHLPKLTFIGGQLSICANNAAFIIPSGPPNAPTGGFVVTGPSKGQPNCNLQQGNMTCSAVICP